MASFMDIGAIQKVGMDIGAIQSADAVAVTLKNLALTGVGV